jgi:tRNA threonylcarbamoyladenosine biosynthesis protein TsaE
MEERICPGEAASRQLGRELAARLRPGDVVLLSGDLGSGKTVFVRGLAEGLGVNPAEVSSPTFALLHEYGPADRPPVLLHADFYRLTGETAGTAVADLGLDRGTEAVLAVEWPRPPVDGLRAFRVTIEELADGARRISIRDP